MVSAPRLAAAALRMRLTDVNPQTSGFELRTVLRGDAQNSGLSNIVPGLRGELLQQSSHRRETLDRTHPGTRRPSFR
ncbi:hypothetical protein DOTSEDRAFT_70656 [Dothistroma septosporum NZE10]|uniref:Uncharacterized protein n=1 Tax=Dothistroma septosporum (strain NZE10 / CBS 128990) TaxID=675120 RepID=N1PTD1_DOTSN|nr:hypothetical protein DOTSEDRAFT_70656 [Dothistroma septosporum NZE10]